MCDEQTPTTKEEALSMYLITYLQRWRDKSPFTNKYLLNRSHVVLSSGEHCFIDTSLSSCLNEAIIQLEALRERVTQLESLFLLLMNIKTKV